MYLYSHKYNHINTDYCRKASGGIWWLVVTNVGGDKFPFFIIWGGCNAQSPWWLGDCPGSLRRSFSSLPGGTVGIVAGEKRSNYLTNATQQHFIFSVAFTHAYMAHAAGSHSSKSLMTFLTVGIYRWGVEINVSVVNIACTQCAFTL